MKQSVLLMAKRHDDRAKRFSVDVAKWLKKHSVVPVDVSGSTGEISAAQLKNTVAGVSFGGDGTFLSLVDRLSIKDRFPLMGVNLGTLGFITSVGKTEAKKVLSRVLSGKFPEERRTVFGLDVLRNGRRLSPGVFLNDAVVLKDASESMLRFEIRLDGALLSCVRADGYILSSATGSTAYALSAGGPMVHPGADIVVLIHICAHALAIRPLIIPSSVRVELIVTEAPRGASLILDGQRRFSVEAGDELAVDSARASLRLVGGATHQWGDALRNKLGMA